MLVKSAPAATPTNTVKTMYYDSINSVLGKIYLLADEQGLRQLILASDGFTPDSHWEHHPVFMAPYIKQLTEYLSGKRKTFTLPLAPQGTDFQRQVWQAISDIPFNHHRSYQELATRLNQPCAMMAVGMAKNVNPIPIIIPCHRVKYEHSKQCSCRYGKGFIDQLQALEKGEVSLI